MSGCLRERIHRRLDALDRGGLRRTLRAPSGIDFSSNDYLGLANHPRVRDAMRAALAGDGVGSTGSRLLRGERGRFSDLENRFAAFKGTARALYFSSGYLANIAAVTTFAERGDLIVSDERNHASLIDGIRLSHARRAITPHNDVRAVRRLLDDDRATSVGERFLVVESLFSMDGDEAPLREYVGMCAETGTNLIVDEAHAVGVYGRRGSGLIEQYELDDQIFLSVNTAGKALGVAGAFVAGAAWAIDYLIQHARPFIFSTAPPPSLAGALEASLDLVEHEPDRRATVLERARQLRSRLTMSGVVVGPGTSHILPVLIGDNDTAVAIAEAMQAEGFDVRAIRPPTVPAGTARLRISINADIPEREIDRFADTLARAMTNVGASSGARSDG